MQQEKVISKDWLRIDPFDSPILKNAPKHQPEKFSQYKDLKDEQDNVIGFLVDDQQYFFNEDGGWIDYNGCYYDKEGQPAGWFVLHPGDVVHEHFYDQDGFYVPSDDENGDLDNVKAEKVKSQQNVAT
ncbi:unnamed protein product (macronuclear) [Paramecium tetraurelia]|uniref:Chromosome undetermined scaffold_1, whole genome shotgun sequence n=1 Tax=Paramecium tetraurelia TaxID=5888 RepID=Q6BFT0_PARTE|nr:hypothetical protein [Paramecium tetraurelia strain d4-2]XP_001423173.1 uncharacterized protein GSPATT00000210001 [Paramecium tetraurelia]CAH03490.1 hypothetical protein PTMB.292 [Paramecium tetraurelia]CAK55775.1 unnamed protein product [Paramecium tetraurelia]|eukprot:XP_001423173.1 hypothetical protein (macronuclear) [Paramecium tetraurelia strain d4-2]